MTQQQANMAMEVLAKLYAQRKGINSPQVTVSEKDIVQKGA